MINTRAEFALSGLRASEILAPRDAGELAQRLAACNAGNRAVVPWGGGTLQHLGNLPARFDAVIQTTNLNQVVEYAYDDLTITVQAGMTLTEIANVLAAQGQFLPLDVPHPEEATIGGVLATGVNGPLRLRYGPARDYMLGNRFATVDGEIIKAGSKVVKNVAGYELHKVQVGAFGTLGILTEATFKLFPKPPAEITVLAAFGKLDDACAAVPKIWQLNTPPLAIELLDAATMKLVEPGAQDAYFVISRFGGSKATMAVARDLCAQAVEEHNASSTETAGDGIKSWRALADLPATLRQEFPDALLVRASVPPKELRGALHLFFETAASLKIPPPRTFAHAAITSIYASFEGDATLLTALATTLRARLHTLHGHLVVESAPASLKKNINAWDEVGGSLKMMQMLKRKFDPNNILNPGRFVGGI